MEHNINDFVILSQFYTAVDLLFLAFSGTNALFADFS